MTLFQRHRHKSFVQAVLLNEHPLVANKRIPLIDALKGFALVLVILYHTGGVLGWSNWLHGEVGVDIFLLVSGFTLTLNSAHLTAAEFVRKRLLRIFPAYWLALLFFSALHAKFIGYWPESASLWLHAFGVHGFAKGVYFSHINDSFWFISLILAMYVVFLGIRKHLENVLDVAAIGMLTTAVAIWAYSEAHHDGGLIQLAVRVPSFFLGVAIGQLLTLPRLVFRITPLLGLALVVMTYTIWRKSIIPIYWFAGLGLAGGFLSLCLLAERTTGGRRLVKDFSWLGVYSYEIFLFHQPLIRDYNYMVYRVYFQTEPTPRQVGIGILVALALVVVLSVLVHKAIDRLFARFRAPRT